MTIAGWFLGSTSKYDNCNFRLDDCGQCRPCEDKRKFGGPGKMNKRCKLRKCLTPKDIGNPSTTPDSYFKRQTWQKNSIEIRPQVENREAGSLTLNGEEIKAELLDNPGTYVLINNENSQGSLTRHEEPSTPGSGQFVKSINTELEKIFPCYKCSNCTNPKNCLACKYCKDMKKYGGPGKLKQKCIHRRCLNPVTQKERKQKCQNCR